MIPVWWSVALTALGGLGWLLVTLDRRIHGFLVGLAAQVAWVTYAVATAQWGFIGSAALFGAINALGLARWLRARRTVAPVAPVDHGGTVAMQRGDGERYIPLLPQSWGPRDADRRDTSFTRYQHYRVFPAPLPSRREIERVMRAEFTTMVELNSRTLSDDAPMSFTTHPSPLGGVGVTARANVVPMEGSS